jgi:hypothetical protein
MDTVKTYYKFIERKGKDGKESKSIMDRIKNARAMNKIANEMADAVKEDLNLTEVQIRNNKELVKTYAQQKEAYEKSGSIGDFMNLQETKAQLESTPRGAFATGKRNIMDPVRRFQRKLAKELEPKKLKQTFEAVFKMARGFLKVFATVILVATAAYLFFSRINLMAFLGGILDGLKVVFEVLKVFFEVAKVAFVMIYDGFLLFVQGINDILDGNFGSGFTKLIQGFATFLGGLILAAATFTFGILIAAGAAALGFIIGFLKGYYDRLQESVEGVIARIALIVVAIVTIATAIVFIASGAWLSVAATFFVGAIAAALASAIPFANDTVNRSGMQLVGERGPELVSLPVGSRVYNNRESRTMAGNTTINVTVQGRVGASDAELQEIAQKIGRMVNMEVNRTTASRTRGA